MKNLLFKEYGDKAYLWISFAYDSAVLSPVFLNELNLILMTVKRHSENFWNYNSNESSFINHHKIDVAIDLTGSFITNDFDKAYKVLGILIRSCVDEIFKSESTNFLTHQNLDALKISKGSNLFESCFQYEVRDSQGSKLLNIKAYDKILDLVGREATFIVSSRLSTILSSGSQPGAFEKLIRKNQNQGMTRLELSIHRDSIERYNPWSRTIRKTWDQKICNAMDKLLQSVLNHRKAQNLLSWSVSVSSVISRLTRTENNILAVGRRHSWIINAGTGHKYHFIGTRAVAGLTVKGQDTQ